jgi:hypothetical protein
MENNSRGILIERRSSCNETQPALNVLSWDKYIKRWLFY